MTLFRGWSPTERQKTAGIIALGVLLVLNPLYIDVFNIDMTEHRYEVESVSIEDGLIRFGDDTVRTDVRGVACVGEVERACAYEHRMVEHGDLRFRSQWSYYRAVSFPLGPSERFAYLGDGYYRRTANNTDNATVLALERVPARTVLRRIAVPVGEVSLRVRYALLVGGIDTDQPLPAAGTVVSTDDGYRYIAETGDSYSSNGSTVEGLFSATGFLAGVGLLWRSYGRLPEG